MANLYIYASEGYTTPQSIPQKFDGKTDWNVVSDEEKAKRGWVVYDPPKYDTLYEMLEIIPEENDGIWSVQYNVVENTNISLIKLTLKNQLAALRYKYQEKSVTITTEADETYTFHTDAVSRGNIGNKYLVAQAYEATNGVGSYTTPWKAIEGHVTTPLTLTDLTNIGMAVEHHVNACFSREAELSTLIDSKLKASTLKAVFDDDFNQGWPVGDEFNQIINPS